MTNAHERAYLSVAPVVDKKHAAMHVGLHKAVSAVMVQMRTRKIGLNSYLHGIGAVDSDRCRGF